MRDAVRLLQDLQESLAVDRIGPKARVHEAACVVERPQRARRQPFDAWRSLVHQEGFKDGVWVLFVKVVAGHFEQAGLLEKALVQGAEAAHDFAALAAQMVFNVQQQDLVELGHCLGGPVVVAHEFFTGTQGQATIGGGVGLVAKGLGHGGLQVEHQTVFAPASDQVQTGADQAEQGLVALDVARLVGGGQARAGQRVPAVAQTGGACDPQDDLQVAQTARRFLAVGFERVRRVLELGVALAHFQHLGLHEGHRIHGRVIALAKRAEQVGVACDQTRLEQRSLHRDVLGRFGQTFAHGPNA